MLAELKPLLEKNFEESGKWAEDANFDPDYESYLEMDKSGRLKVFTIRNGGRLVGYAVYFLLPHRHSKRLRLAVNDMIYLLPEYRNGFVIRRCLGVIEKIMYSLGAKVLCYEVPDGNSFKRVLNRLGYRDLETTCVKRLGD